MRGIVREHQGIVLAVIAGIILVMGFMFLPMFPAGESWFSQHPRRAEAMRPQGMRLEILASESLFVTSKTAPVQFASSVTPQAVNTWVFVEGEGIRWDPATTSPTQDTGGKFEDSDEVWLEAEEIPNSDFILDRDALTTGTTIFAIHYKRANM